MKIARLASLALFAVSLVCADAALAAESRSVAWGLSVELSKDVYAPGETIVIKCVGTDRSAGLDLSYGWVGPVEPAIGSTNYYATYIDGGLAIEIPEEASEGRYFVGLLQFEDTVVNSTDGHAVGPKYFDVVNSGFTLEASDKFALKPIYFEVRR